jgi:hypothetical protein
MVQGLARVIEGNVSEGGKERRNSDQDKPKGNVFPFSINLPLGYMM